MKNPIKKFFETRKQKKKMKELNREIANMPDQVKRSIKEDPTEIEKKYMEEDGGDEND